MDLSFCFAIIRHFGVFPRPMSHVNLPGDYSVNPFDERMTILGQHLERVLSRTHVGMHQME